MVVLNPVPQKDGWIWVGIVFCLRMRLKTWSFSFLCFCRGGCGHHLVNFSGFIQGLELASGGIQCKYIIPRAGPAAKFQHVLFQPSKFGRKNSLPRPIARFSTEAKQSRALRSSRPYEQTLTVTVIGLVDFFLALKTEKTNGQLLTKKCQQTNNFQKEKQASVVSEQNNYHGIFHGLPFFICFFNFGVAHSVFAYRPSPVTFAGCVTLAVGM